MTIRTNSLGCDAILFDLDGVLVDSIHCILRHWKVWADRHSIDINKIIAVFHGLRTVEAIRLVAPHLDAEKEAMQLIAQEASDPAGVVPIEGAHRLLTGLPESAWGIVTSGTLGVARARLVHAELPVPKILVTADDVRQGKPAPEPYLVGARRLGLSADRCAVIEDAPAGITAGKKAGMRVIGVATTHKREELLEEGADIVFDRLIDLQIREGKNGYRLVIDAA
jgi:sugar-phosphatase